MPNNKVDGRFLYYLLQYEAPRIAQMAGGAATPIINKSAFSGIIVRVPDAQTMSSIGELLGALDDLIENSRRRIEVLEEVAHRIYREWFVHFRYPGHENGALVDSTLGLIPAGWDVKSLGDISKNFDRLRKPLSKLERQQRRGSVPYYGAAKVIDWVDGWIFDGEYLLFAEDGSVQTPDGFPVLQLVHEKFWANNHTHILQGDGVSARFIYLASAGQPIAGYVTGAAQPKITQANLNRMPIVVGSPDVHQAFNHAVNPIFDLLLVLHRQTASLVAVRDMLLPKLVTGQIDVSSLDFDALVADSVA